jgi:hypothetical protein
MRDFLAVMNNVFWSGPPNAAFVGTCPTEIVPSRVPSGLNTTMPPSDAT